jgi:HIRAN domain
MDNWLENICEPRLLILAWQAPDHLKERFRWAVGEVKPTSDGFSFRYFAPGKEFESRNAGKTFDQIVALGYAGYAAFPVKVREHASGVLEAFNRRLPPRGRSDFSEYMKHFRLKDYSSLSNFTLLGKTEATLPSDGFSIVDPLDGSTSCCDLLLEVAGFRYYANTLGYTVTIGTQVEISPEPENKFDSNAVRFSLNGSTIGYVNRLQATAFHQWIKNNKISAVVERINGKIERPRVFLFVRVRPSDAQIAA